MIKLLSTPDELLPAAAQEPALGSMLMSSAVAAEGDSTPADIWLCCNGESVCGALGLIGRDVIILAEGLEPDEELCSFAELLLDRSDGVLCGERFSSVLKSRPELKAAEQPVLKRDISCTSAPSLIPFEQPRRLEDCRMLLAAESADFAAGDTEEWLLRVSRTMRRSQCDVLMVYDGDLPAATASIMGRTPGAGLIAGVVTAAGYRRRSFASALVAELACRLENEGRSAFIVPADERAGRLYSRLGFTPEYSQWHFRKG